MSIPSGCLIFRSVIWRLREIKFALPFITLQSGSGLLRSPLNRFKLSPAVKDGHFDDLLLFMTTAVSQLPLIRTKLRPPQTIADYLTRPRLSSLLEVALEGPLCLVSAPAGYGKTSLIAEWARPLPIAQVWIDLGEAESELPLFLTYLLTALEAIDSEIFSDTLSLLSNPREPEFEEFAVAIINALDDFGEPLLIVLDDYHLIKHDSAVHRLIDFLMKYPPVGLHLVLLTRRDPPINLSGMRAKGKLLEIRAQDLRFTEDETGAVLTAATGAALSSETVMELDSKIEGWAAGLRMAAMLIRRQENHEGFLSSLQGGIAQITEYLQDEVVSGLPAELKYCLLCSAIPDSFCSELLQAVLESDEEGVKRDAQVRLFVDFVEGDNLFTTAVDPGRQWFRYHHLFRDALRAELKSYFCKEELEKLYVKNILWLESRQLLSEAISLATECKNVPLASELVGRHCASTFDWDESTTVHNWLLLLPPDAIDRRADLLLADTWVAGYQLDLERITARVSQLEEFQVAGALTSEQTGMLAFFRGMIAFWAGDIAEALVLAEQAALTVQFRGLYAAEVQVSVALAAYMTGDRSGASAALSESASQNPVKDSVYSTRLSAADCYIRYFQLQTYAALNAADHIMLISTSSWESKYAQAWAAHMRAMVFLNTGKLVQAIEAFSDVVKISRNVEPRVVINSLFGMALAYELAHDKEAARGVAERIMQFTDSRHSVEFRELAKSGAARLALLDGDISTAFEQARTLPGKPQAGTLVFWLDEPGLTVARVRLARGKPSDLSRALQILTEFHEQVESQHLYCQLVDILLLEAITRDRLEQRTAALQLVGKALTLAAPGNWRRPFLEIGKALAPLIEAAELGEDEREFAEELGLVNSALDVEPPVSFDNKASPSTGMESEVPALLPGDSVINLFTNRELDILDLLEQRYRNKEIASRLFISPHTVNYHLKHIFQKLDVSGRRAAVARAQELGVPFRGSPRE